MHKITIQDIRSYLASLAPDQSCGTPARPRACLVEKALEYKYPGEVFLVNSDAAWSLERGATTFSLQEDVTGVVLSFDTLAPKDNPTNISITRQQVEDAIPSLKG